MFTGLIEEIGYVKQVSHAGQSMILSVDAKHVVQDVKMGDSISVNGVCLTVVSFDDNSFAADIMPETYRKTNLHELRSGHPVNLERAMPANGRFGGHIVQGHVDTIGKILKRHTEHNAVVFRIEVLNRALMRYMIPQGSITVDGISLTIVDVDQSALVVSIIPHTLDKTSLKHKQSGEAVNLECDVIGKYVERLLAHDKSKMSEQFLTEHGFI